VRRNRLLASIGARLEIRSRTRGRVLELLALGDDELLAAVGAESPGPCAFDSPARVSPEAICRHDREYPPSLTDDGAPRLLHVRGDLGRLRALASPPAVAICGSTRSTDYGIEIARTIARELATRGVTIVSGLADGAAAAAQHGAAQAGAGAIAVLAGGHRTGCPAAHRPLARRIAQGGCVVAELPEECAGRVWGRIAAARVLARLAALTLVVEADDTPVDLSPARVARDLGRTVAVVPGRVTSPASRGAHRLLGEGAHLARGTADVLAVLGEVTAPARTSVSGRLESSLTTTLELVGAGSDTPEKLERAGVTSSQALLALSRLEVLGLLARGDGGRYVVCGGLHSGPCGLADAVRPHRAIDPLA
jgi:DNA processing protein